MAMNDEETRVALIAGWSIHFAAQNHGAGDAAWLAPDTGSCGQLPSKGLGLDRKPWQRAFWRGMPFGSGPGVTVDGRRRRSGGITTSVDNLFGCSEWSWDQKRLPAQWQWQPKVMVPVRVRSRTAHECLPAHCAIDG